MVLYVVYLSHNHFFFCLKNEKQFRRYALFWSLHEPVLCKSLLVLPLSHWQLATQIAGVKKLSPTICIFIGLPSSGTLLYLSMAARASICLRKTTFAVPCEKQSASASRGEKFEEKRPSQKPTRYLWSSTLIIMDGVLFQFTNFRKQHLQRAKVNMFSIFS